MQTDQLGLSSVGGDIYSRPLHLEGPLVSQTGSVRIIMVLEERGAGTGQ